MLPATLLFLAFAPASGVQIQPRELDARVPIGTIHFKYPEIDNARPFNEAVHRVVDPIVDSFKNTVPDVLPPNSAEGSLDGHYSSAILKNGIVSVLLEWSVYVPGAAHPGSFEASINYDSRARRVLRLSDLFRPGTNYVALLSQLSIASLEQNEYAEIDKIREGAGPVESNFQVFTLTGTALVLHFPAYQVAAGAAGPKEVTIPLDRLSRILRKH
jgi:hypothetical protein